MSCLPSIKELVHSGALFVANHSGGKDSQIQLIRLLEIIPREQLLVVHASLGDVEWPGALELAQKQAEDAGVPFIVATATKTFFEMVEHRYATKPEVPSFPSSSTRQCTSDLKRGPIRREVRRYAKARGFDVIVNCLGFRQEESPARRKRPEFSKLAISNSVATWYEWLPVHDLTVDQVFSGILGAGQQPHPAYGLQPINGRPVATKNSRLSCIFCLFGSKGDIQHGAQEHPELLEKFDALEKRTGYTMHMSRIPLVELSA